MSKATRNLLKKCAGCQRGIKGFTLIELLISMSIGLIVLYALYNLFTFQKTTYNTQEQIVAMQQGARAAMDMMVNEIFMAGYNPANISSTGITSASTNSITFKQDLDGSGDVSGSNENITYVYDPNNLRITRNTGGGAQLFAENVEAMNLYYYNANGATTTTPADIRKIKIEMRTRTAKKDPRYSANSGYRTFSLSCYVIPRNLAY